MTRARRSGGVSRQPGYAACAAAFTAASMSAALQNGTRLTTAPVAGLVTSPDAAGERADRLAADPERNGQRGIDGFVHDRSPAIRAGCPRPRAGAATENTLAAASRINALPCVRRTTARKERTTRGRTAPPGRLALCSGSAKRARSYWLAVIPPSMYRVWPVMNAPAGRAEEQRRARDVARLAEPAERDAWQGLGEEVGTCEMVRDHLGADVGRRDPVHRDGMRRELHRVLLHQQREPALAGAIGRVAASANPKGGAHRPEVHLAPAAAMGYLVPRGGLREKHRRLQVELIDLVERLLGHLEQRLLAVEADGVDQDVEPAVLAHDRLHRRADARDRMRVEGVAGRPVPRAAEARRGRVRLLGATSRDGDRGAVHREAPGDRLADPAIAARQERDHAAEIEQPREIGPEIELRCDRAHRQSQSITRPPFKSTISPVMNPASGEARNRTTCANSSGSQKRPTGTCASSACRCASVSCSVTIGVFT